ncbi:hypothetical protein ACFW9X_25165, partial [Streptomyces sp. NPDC059466]
MSENTDRHETAVARYLEAWNADGPDALAKAVAAAWSADGGYTDPLADVRGHESRGGGGEGGGGRVGEAAPRADQCDVGARVGRGDRLVGALAAGD